MTSLVEKDMDPSLRWGDAVKGNSGSARATGMQSESLSSGSSQMPVSNRFHGDDLDRLGLAIEIDEVAGLAPHQRLAERG